MGLYTLSELTNWERWRIRKCTRTPIEETAKKFNTSYQVVYNLLGNKTPNFGRIKQIFEDGSYNIWERIGYIPYNRVKILECLRQDRESYMNCLWRWNNKPNPRKLKIKIKQVKIMIAKNKGKPVFQLDKAGNFIKEFRAIREASRELGIPQGNISNIANEVHGFKSAKGFRFEFKFKTHKVLFGKKFKSDLW